METDLFWLDDFRTAPDGWDWAESYWTAVQMLTNNDYRHGSLDHDLFQYWGYKNYSHWTSSWDDDKTGLDVLEWIIENDRWPSESLAIHTDLPHKRGEMADLIEWYGPYKNGREWYTRHNAPDPVTGYVFWNDERPDESLFKWANWNGVPAYVFSMSDW